MKTDTTQGGAMKCPTCPNERCDCHLGVGNVSDTQVGELLKELRRLKDKDLTRARKAARQHKRGREA